MTDFLKNHKKLCIITGIIAAVIVFAVYLFALFLPGYWFGDTFLYEKGELFEGVFVFSGHDTENDADYELTMAKDGKTAYMVFTVNETERSYEITSNNDESYNPSVTIIENGKTVFTGTERSGFLFDENDEIFEPPITITYDTYEPTEEELFPSYTWLYSVSQSVKTEIRGEPLWLIAIVFLAGIVIFDIVYPDLFWELDHWLDTKGGEPSEFYRFTQKALWIFAPILIIIIMIISFMPDMYF